MNTPKVSVCLPNHNKEKYIGKTIASILSQSYTDFEFLIIDNASTDNSVKIIKQFDDPRIDLIINDINIKAENWNKCVTLAKGELVALFHSDDEYEKDIIENQVAAFRKNPDLGAVFTAANIIDANGDVTGSMFLEPSLGDTERIDFDMAFSNYIECGRGSFVCPSTMIPKKVYKEIGGYDFDNFRYAFDYDLYFRVLEKHPVRILKEKLMRYRQYSGQGTSQVIKKHHFPDELYKLFNKFIVSPALSQPLDSRLVRKIIKGEKSDFYLCALNAIRRGDIRKAKEYTGMASAVLPDIYDKFISFSLDSGIPRVAAGAIILRYER
jgi:glycosyltransferase involved in cell wall biosynthesis